MAQDILPIDEIASLLERIRVGIGEDKSFRVRVLIEMIFIEIVWIQEMDPKSEKE